MKQDQKGFSAVEALVILMVVGLLGFIGYRVYESSSSATSDSSTNSTSATKSEDSLAWQAGGVAIAGTYADADVVQVSDNQWRMYYAIQPEVQGHQFEVFSATSTDGKSWTQESGIRKTMATFPEVIKLSDGRYRMYFQQAGVIKSAISSDGLSFTDETGTRIDTANSEGLTFDNVAAPTIVQQDDGTFVLVYRGTINTRYAANTPNPTTQVLMWATSNDGLSFTKKGLAVDSRNDTLNGQLDGPDLVLWDDGEYRLLATSYTGVHEFSFDGDSFGEPTLALAGEAKKTSQGFTGSPPGDPTTAKIDGTWYMFYGGPREQNGIHYATYE